jgi:hypothetical protein
MTQCAMLQISFPPDSPDGIDGKPYLHGYSLNFPAFGYAYPHMEEIKAWIVLPHGRKIYGRPESAPYPFNWWFSFQGVPLDPHHPYLTPLTLVVKGNDCAGNSVCDVRHFFFYLNEYAGPTPSIAYPATGNNPPQTFDAYGYWSAPSKWIVAYLLDSTGAAVPNGVGTQVPTPPPPFQWQFHFTNVNNGITIQNVTLHVDCLKAAPPPPPPYPTAAGSLTGADTVANLQIN